MLSNVIEFKDFLSYYQTILNTCARIGENTKIYLSHNDDTMTIKVISDSGISIDTFHCSNKLYHEIAELIYSTFISTNKIMLATTKNKFYSVRSEKIEIISIINPELSEKISNQGFSNVNESNKKDIKLSEFEKISDFFRCYSNFLKRCVKKENKNTIKVDYKDRIYSINITSNGEIIFSRTITCNNIKARYLDKTICENLIDENSIQLSSITKNNQLQIQTPKFCLFIPYNNLERYHNEALAKMNEYNMQFSMQKVKSSNR